MLWAVSPSVPTSRPSMTTAQPRRTSSAASARPKPREPPVTIAVLVACDLVMHRTVQLQVKLKSRARTGARRPEGVADIPPQRSGDGGSEPFRPRWWHQASRADGNAGPHCERRKEG